MKKINLYYTTMSSPVGTVHLGKTKRGLKFISFSRAEWLKQLASLKKTNSVILHHDVGKFKSLKVQLKRYFSGKKVKFETHFDLADSTDFQKRVWSKMSKIPFGQTRSYGWLAQKVGIKSPRAIGQACGSNPLPIVIPCHRVIAYNGKLGGYGGGLAKKAKLLKLEGALK